MTGRDRMVRERTAVSDRRAESRKSPKQNREGSFKESGIETGGGLE